ncbi:hypothetical protein I6E29_05470 [Arcanobacterium haemolyticum]|nr:hypothetical protein [Arcanobacterium haemolyticum]
MYAVFILVGIAFFVPEVGPYALAANSTLVLVNLLAIVFFAFVTYAFARLAYRSVLVPEESWAFRFGILGAALFTGYLTFVFVYIAYTISADMVLDLFGGTRTATVVDCLQWRPEEYNGRFGVSRGAEFTLRFEDGRVKQWIYSGVEVVSPWERGDGGRIAAMCTGEDVQPRTLTWYPRTMTIARFE